MDNVHTIGSEGREKITCSGLVVRVVDATSMIPLLLDLVFIDDLVDGIGIDITIVVTDIDIGIGIMPVFKWKEWFSMTHIVCYTFTK